jgi:hypothetical protein
LHGSRYYDYGVHSAERIVRAFVLDPGGDVCRQGSDIGDGGSVGGEQK